MRFLTDYEDFVTEGQPNAVQEFIISQGIFPNPIEEQRLNEGIAFFGETTRLSHFCWVLTPSPTATRGPTAPKCCGFRSESRKTRSSGWKKRGRSSSASCRNATGGTASISPASPRFVCSTPPCAGSLCTAESGTRPGAIRCAQEDMAVTNLTFSFLIIKGLRKLNVSVAKQEEERICISGM